MPDLTPFEGADVVAATVAIRNTGDGLSQAMGIDPVEYHGGERLYVVLECDVVDLQFPLADKDNVSGPRVRKHILKAGHAVVVDADLVKGLIDTQADAIARAKEAAAGIQRLDFGDDGDDDEDGDGEPADVVSLGDQLDSAEGVG